MPVVCGMWAAVWALVLAVPLAEAQSVPLPDTIVEVRVEREGRAVTDPSILALIETKVGEPLSARDVRETIAHLYALAAFEDIPVRQEPAPGGGVILRYVLVPAHPIDRLAFEGMLGVGEDDLRRVVLDQFGVVPRAAQAENATKALQAALRDRGFPSASVTASVVQTHDPDRATMVFRVQSGRRAIIEDTRVTLADGGAQPSLLVQPDVGIGDPYDKVRVDRALERWVDAMHERGYYEARASHGVLFPDAAVVSITLTQGPLIRIAFAGDALGAADRARLVPVRTEGSADEDLLEDSARAIEAFLKAEGHRDATARYDRVPQGGEVTITFTITRGPQYVVASVGVAGNTGISATDVRTALGVAEGQTFSEEVLARGVAAVRNAYRARGYARVQVAARQSVVVPERASESRRRLAVQVDIVEGPRAVLQRVTFEGQTVLDAVALAGIAALVPGQAFTEADVAAARSRIDFAYRDRGYDQFVVQSQTALAENDTRADVLFTLTEGAQVIVDRVLIVGNVRTKLETIRRELTLVPGQPLSYSALVDSKLRLDALALFRRVTIEEIAHGTEPRRDLLVRVEESLPNSFGYGGGLEGAFRTRTGATGQAVERFEVVPRGFFEIGRRNLWGKNRTANLFGRVSVRNTDVGLTETGAPVASPDAGFGFNEYRVVGTFREPRIFGLTADVLVTGILEQAIRSSFNFVRREVRGEAGWRVSRVYSMSGRYSFERTELFDQRFTDSERTLIDRLFPQVRLSSFSGSFVRDTRDDPVDTSRGALVTVTGDLAARALGSEVGFTKTYAEVFSFTRLPSTRRTIVALGARVGAANGFRRDVLVDSGPGGVATVTVVDDIPASKRFFAGGDTTVRGFALDRLGDDTTISPSGFPTGGNGVVILNSELRVDVGGRLQAVGFLDAGNVVSRASSLSLVDLRTAAGVGIRYRLPVVGAVRLDLGFKLDRRELSPGRLERRSLWHISLGQAF